MKYTQLVEVETGLQKEAGAKIKLQVRGTGGKNVRTEDREQQLQIMVNDRTTERPLQSWWKCK